MNSPVQAGQRGAAYEVLCPWAEADPVQLRGITPRVKNLAGKKIGLFSNNKRAAALTLTAVETRLKELVPSIQTTRYTYTRTATPEMLSEGKARFEAWVSGVDAVVLSVGD